MIKVKSAVAVCLSWMAAISADAAVTLDTVLAWELRRDRDQVQVYTAEVEGSPYDAVLARTVIRDVRLSSMVALIMDAQACQEWAAQCAESFVHDELGPGEFHIYTHNELPFPVKDRDVMARIKWSQDPESGTVVMHSRPEAGVYPEQRGKLRLTDADVYWQFRPLENNAVEVTNLAHIDPGSALPGWITNILLVDTPFDTMKSFASYVQRPKYTNANFEFVEEP